MVQQTLPQHPCSPAHVGSNIFHPKNMDDYHNILWKSLSSVVMVKSEWCPVSKKHEALLFQISKSRPELNFIFADMEKMPQIKGELNVRMTPTVFILLNETVHSRIDGASEYVELHIKEMEKEKHLRELIYNNLRTVVFFHSRSTTESYHIVSTKFDEYSKKYENLARFEKYIYEDCTRLHRSFVRATQCPCFCFFKGGKLKKRVEGHACKTHLDEAIHELTSDDPHYDTIDLLPSYDEFLSTVDTGEKLHRVLDENSTVVVGCFLQQDLNEKTPEFGHFANSVSPQTKCICINLSHFPSLKTHEGIDTVPTFIFYLNGHLFKKVRGSRHTLELEHKEMLESQIKEEFKRVEKSHYHFSRDHMTSPTPQTKKLSGNTGIGTSNKGNSRSANCTPQPPSTLHTKEVQHSKSALGRAIVKK